MKPVLITGGSRGIGAATARLAARRGYAVCINYKHRKEDAAALVREIEGQGGRATAIQADVSIECDLERLFDSCDRAFGRLSALINNAGILETQMRVDSMDRGRLQRVFATNVFAAFAGARLAALRMSTKYGGSGGVIVNVSSMAARYGGPGEYVDYAATKGALDSFTIGLAREVAEEGIRVNAVRPGFIDTEIHAGSGDANRIDRVRHLVPMKRGGTAEEVAEAIVWLMSDAASYVTGTFIDVAGGR